jgi:hypothetical protein
LKKFIILATVFIALASYACKGKQVPGAPYDFLPTFTPTAYYNVNFTVYSTQTPLANATVVLIYPDKTKTITGTTNADGRAGFKVSDAGAYTLYLSHSTIQDSAAYPIYNDYNVSNGTNDFTVNVDTGSLTLIAHSPSMMTYGSQGGDYIYYLKYDGTMKRKILPFKSYGMWVTGVYDRTTFIPEYIDSPGTSITVKITLPKYFHQNDEYPKFDFAVCLNTNVITGLGMNSAFAIRPNPSADWLFNTKLASAVVYDPSSGRIRTSLQLFTANININNVCVKINKYEYFIGGQWVDHAYYGGEAEYKVNGFSADANERYCLMGTTFYVELGYPGYSGSAAKGRLTLDFVDRNDDSRIIQAVIENPY